jgi:hypothetical protein
LDEPAVLWFRIWVSGPFVKGLSEVDVSFLGALYPSKSRPIHKHIVKRVCFCVQEGKFSTRGRSLEEEGHSSLRTQKTSIFSILIQRPAPSRGTIRYTRRIHDSSWISHFQQCKQDMYIISYNKPDKLSCQSNPAQNLNQTKMKQVNLVVPVGTVCRNSVKD